MNFFYYQNLNTNKSIPKKLIATILICFLNLTACHSTKTIENPNPSSQDLVYAKLIHDFELNRFTEIEANEAFLLAKSYETENKIPQAEKLLEICYHYTKNIYVALNLIQVKITLKKISAAKEIANYTHIIFPNNSDILLVLIQINQMENDTGEISKLLAQGLVQFPQNEQIVILNALFNKEKSKEILTRFLKSNPNSPNVLEKLSAIYYQENKTDKALSFLKKAYNLNNDNIGIITTLGKLYEKLKNYPEAELMYKIAFEKDMENNINAQNYINILLTQKKQQKALSILLKLDANSDTSVPFPQEFSYEIGRILILNEDYAGAKTQLENILKLDPDQNSVVSRDEILFLLGYTYENLRLFQLAIETFDKINPTSPVAPSAQKEKILVLINSKQKDKALELFQNLKITPQSSVDDILFQTSLTSYFKSNQEALDLLNSNIEKNKLEKRYYLKKIDLLIRLNSDKNTIINQAKQIVKMWPKYPDGLNILGYLLIQEPKKLKEAEKLLKQSLIFDPKNPYYMDSLGCLYTQKHDYNLAQNYFLSALKISSNEPVILYHTATVLKLMKKQAEAQKMLERTRTLISNMLIYSVESDYELKEIAAKIQIPKS